MKSAINKLIRLIICSVFILCCISGCSPSERTYSYEEFEPFTLTEPMDNHYLFLLNGKKFTLGNTEIYIDDRFTEKEQQGFVRFADDVFEFLKADLKVTYYVMEEFSSRIDGDTIYLGTDDKTVFIHTTLQYLGDSRLNYGVLWGISEHLRANLDNKTIKPDNAKANQLLKTFPEFADLNAMLFYEPYSTKEDIASAKTVAVSFTEWLYGKGKEILEELLVKNLSALKETVGGEAFSDYDLYFTALKNEYLQYLGVDVTASPHEQFIRCVPYTNRYPLILETDWGRLHIQGSYKSFYTDDYWYGDTEAPYSDFSYDSMNRLLANMHNDARSMLSDFNLTFYDIQPGYDYYLDSIYAINGYSQVTWNKTVELSTLALWAHEFTHVIFFNLNFYPDESDTLKWMPHWRWFSEGMACYMIEQRAPNSTGFTPAYINIVKSHDWYSGLYNLIRPTVDCDERAREDIYTYLWVLNGEYGFWWLDSSYDIYNSFIYYLVDNFGFEALVTIALGSTVEEALGFDLNTLWREWGTDLFKRFGDETPPEDFLNFFEFIERN